MTREGPSGQWGAPSTDGVPENLLQVLFEIPGRGGVWTAAS